MLVWIAGVWHDEVLRLCQKSAITVADGKVAAATQDIWFEFDYDIKKTLSFQIRVLFGVCQKILERRSETGFLSSVCLDAPVFG